MESVTIPLRLLGDRVLIRADLEDHAPSRRDSGLFVANTLTAAVTGADAARSWCVGTVVAIGPAVRRFAVRPYVLRRLQELIDEDTNGVVEQELVHLRRDIEALPSELAEGVAVGDRVTFSWTAGQELTIDTDSFIIVRAAEILAVLTD